MATQTRLLRADLEALGANITRWRKVRELTAQMVADRAGITRATLRSIEHGEGSARLENVVAVMRVLGFSDLVITATDPLTTDIGRARADWLLPQRVKPPTSPRRQIDDA
ncbi:helix-turn-helix domain-containing protein [Agromyces humi]|uniref:helix-turn-helix domain-containing protein n=1 Tax=Agromyces humi TaxID=1766800 RepID=UPI0013581CFC|nr:helix-turn-helix transcriptional regulator [Agromyces humi]